MMARRSLLRDKAWLPIGLLLISQIIMAYTVLMKDERIKALEDRASRPGVPVIEAPAQMVTELQH